MNKSKLLRWLVALGLFIAMLPFTPGLYWKFYWFNYRIMERVNEIITAI